MDELPLATEAASPVTAAPIGVEADVPCIACGYNVRGLPVDGRCPECGHEVPPSVAAHRAGGLTSEQARRAYGVSRMGVAAIIVMLGAGTFSGDWDGQASPAPLALGLLSWVLASLIAFRLPVVQGSESLRRAAIGFSIAAGAMPTLFFSLIPLVLGSLWRWWPLMMLPSVLASVAGVLIFVTLSRVARKARHPDLARLLRLVAVLSVVAMVALTVAVPMNRPTYSADFVIRQPPPVVGMAVTVSMIAAHFRAEYLSVWQFHVWLVQPTLTVMTLVALYRLGQRMKGRIARAAPPRL